MRRMLRSTTAVCAGLSMALSTPLAAQTLNLPTAEQLESATQDECLEMVKIIELGDDAPAEARAALLSIGTADDICEALENVVLLIDPESLAQGGTGVGEASVAGGEMSGADAGAEANAEVAAKAQPEVEPEVIEQGAGDATGDASDAAEVETSETAQGEGDMAEQGAPEVTEMPGEKAGNLIEEVADAVADAGAAADAGGDADVANEAPEVPAALSEEAEVAQQTTQTVTEETARSSDEDFQAATSDAPDGDNLSTLERALIVGAGALAVGTILNGNREVVDKTPDRVIVQTENGDLQVLKDDNALLLRPGAEVETETYSDGSSRMIVSNPDGSQIITIRDPELRIVRRIRITPEGQEVVLIDDTTGFAPVDLAELPEVQESEQTVDMSDREALRQALAAQNTVGRTFSLRQVRDIERVRKIAPAISVDNITFETNSAAIRPSQAESLAEIGSFIADAVRQNPEEIFLIEGHTDAVGSASYNLLLSDRRAESVALALTEYFDVPPENLVVQGYGESDLRISTEEAERANRRAVVRRITPLLQLASR